MTLVTPYMIQNWDFMEANYIPVYIEIGHFRLVIEQKPFFYIS